MDSMISRRGALGLALAAVPGTVALAVAQPADAHAADGSLVAVQAAGSETTASDATAAETPVAVAYKGVSIAARGNVKGSGWTGWRASGTVVGKQAGKGLVALRLQLKGLQGLAGGVRYQVYKRGVGWQAPAADGKATATVRNVEGVKVKLTGDVATHYDVLYRVYMSGRGWGKWVKNGSRAGTLGKRSRVNAMQVKLSPKTMEAAGKSLATTGLRCEAYVRKTGWQSWVAAGKTAGTTGKSRPLGGFALAVDGGSVGGSATYHAYLSGTGWQGWKENGKFAGSTGRNLEAVAIKLSGALAKKYNVYYRAHVSGYGWLDWAKNGATAGSTGFSRSIEGMQVKLVAKGAAAPGSTKYPTVNKLEGSKRLNGFDISSAQAGINVAAVPGHFIIVKATQGNWYTNPYFTQHAKATLACGKLLGIYHYADLQGSATQQADYFIKHVKPYIGQCVLVLDWENKAVDLGTAWAKKFLDRVHKKTGVKPLIYLSQWLTTAYDWSSVAANYKLWVAQYLYRNMYSGYLSKPDGGTNLGYWSSATIYQYSSTGQLKGYGGPLDLDKFYGSAAIWKQLCTGA